MADISGESFYTDAAINRLIAGYTPEEEPVVILLKEAQRTSAYRVRARFPEESTPPSPFAK